MKMPVQINNDPETIFENPYTGKRARNRVSVSSASSCQSDSSEDAEGSFRKPSLGQEDEDTEKVHFSRFRSMSDGADRRLSIQKEPFEVFPSLPDSVLQKMGLLGNPMRERTGDLEDLEQKFVSLSLAFTIDAATIKSRCERQRRYRDQTETNLAVELEKLIQKANCIQPLCVDAETTELLVALLAQIDLVTRAATYATISSERYGAVQHEDRISEAVHLMVNHVNLLKQQRDAARRQLQYTKRMLQNSNTAETPPPLIPNGAVTRRRASIATIDVPPTSPDLIKKITRRQSEKFIRAASFAPSRNPRPSRVLELGRSQDLVKIKEGVIENDPSSTTDFNTNSDNEDSNHEENSSSHEDESIDDTTFRNRIRKSFRKFRKRTEDSYERWTKDGTMHEICCFCALMCFSISIIILANIFIELEFAKRGIETNSFFSLWRIEESHSKRMYQSSLT